MVMQMMMQMMHADADDDDDDAAGNDHFFHFGFPRSPTDPIRSGAAAAKEKQLLGTCARLQGRYTPAGGMRTGQRQALG